jgi:hypothetical protein
MKLTIKNASIKANQAAGGGFEKNVTVHIDSDLIDLVIETEYDYKLVTDQGHTIIVEKTDLDLSEVFDD